ncbi:hypothetical protein [Rhodopirellula europaea]|jgi:hypothetical protein|uniref:Uncharacterized protein n=1 Tax=Rhodopirellula europaea SH398 TaxID=1263868 RepID=M5SDW5_9BACT|nr:hypothetical protein [Rhodopirellula europaea]EMI25867.1 hypothetical protein RESH_03488 [Rhodopirellula europaea SH398]
MDTKQAIAVSVDSELAFHEFFSRKRLPHTSHLHRGKTNRNRAIGWSQTGHFVLPDSGEATGVVSGVRYGLVLVCKDRSGVVSD